MNCHQSWKKQLDGLKSSNKILLFSRLYNFGFFLFLRQKSHFQLINLLCFLIIIFGFFHLPYLIILSQLCIHWKNWKEDGTRNLQPNNIQSWEHTSRSLPRVRFVDDIHLTSIKEISHSFIILLAESYKLIEEYGQNYFVRTSRLSGYQISHPLSFFLQKIASMDNCSC